jgi:chromosome segregation ATPase
MNIDVAATRARAAEDTQALESRLTRLHRRLGDLVEELTEVHAQTRAALVELDDLGTAQTASNHAVNAASQPS